MPFWRKSIDEPQRRWPKILLALIAIIAVGGGGWYWRELRSPVDSIQIYRGVTYTCVRLFDTGERGGLVHIIEVDLTAPGISLWTTPTDAAATARGWEYVLSRVGP